MWWRKISMCPVSERALLIQTAVTWGHNKRASEQARILLIYRPVCTSEIYNTSDSFVSSFTSLFSNFAKPVQLFLFHFPGVFFFFLHSLIKKYSILVSKWSGFIFIHIKLFHFFSLRVIIMFKCLPYYYFCSLYPVAIYVLWGLAHMA